MTKNIIEEIKQIAWTKSWTGKYSLLSCTLFGLHYTKVLEDFLGFALKSTIIIYKQGICESYLSIEEFAQFGQNLKQKVEENQELIKLWSAGLEKETDILLKLSAKALALQQLSEKEYAEYIRAYFQYANYHFIAKRVVDFLDPVAIEKFLPILEKARKYSEPVYEKFEEVIARFIKIISSQYDYPEALIHCLTSDEFAACLRNKVLPPKDILEVRSHACALIFNYGKYDLIEGEEIIDLEKNVAPKQNELQIIKGISAYPGKMKGKVKVVLDPAKANDFSSGDILAAHMTRPEYLPLMKKASAFITDAGGMLCHAAISARELKKPCIVGTEIATKVLKDGDLVEVDADRGIVRIINS